MSSAGGDVTFNQDAQTVNNQTNVGTVAGNLNIGAHTSRADMRQAIAALKAELATLKDVPPHVRVQVNEALDSAARVETPSPKHAELKEKLDSAGSALSAVAAQIEGADDIAQKALKLAKTIFSIGKWIIAAVLA